jgi:hypothetical protein
VKWEIALFETNEVLIHCYGLGALFSNQQIVSRRIVKLQVNSELPSFDCKSDHLSRVCNAYFKSHTKNLLQLYKRANNNI